MLFLALASWVLRTFRAQAPSVGLGILLPGLFVALVSIVADKGENMRFKFFVEPVLIVFLVSQAFVLLGRSQKRSEATSAQLRSL